MSNEVTEKQLLGFLNQINKLSSMEFIGLAKFFNIPLVEQDEDKTPRPAEFIISDLIDKYISLNRNQRKNLKKILAKAIKG